ncbi:MAG: Gx transporter family protein [Oscillospiraceae bacterium]|nr:Gx transporter family protein [Oscillospiraceae bacterium]
MKPKRLMRLALLSAVSLVLFVLENQIPAPIPVPGVKLGLGNVIVVATLYLYGRREALAVLLVKLLLSSLLTGNLSALAYSAAGGLLSWGGMSLLRPLLRPGQLWVASVLGAMLHNLGQLLTAVQIAATPGLFAYLPVLLLSGMVTGLFTGLAAQELVRRLRHSSTYTQHKKAK